MRLYAHDSSTYDLHHPMYLTDPHKDLKVGNLIFIEKDWDGGWVILMNREVKCYGVNGTSYRIHPSYLEPLDS